MKKIWDKNEVIKNGYILNNEFNDDLTSLQAEYNCNSLYEPYYCFYLWLRRKNKKFIFLNTEMSNDQITNSVMYNDKIILYHTWFARAYGNSAKHTKRIDDIFNLLSFEENKILDPIIFKDYTFFWIKKIKKNYKRTIRKFNIRIK